MTVANIVIPAIGVGDGGRAPPPQKKIGKKYFSGNYYEKFGHFSGKYHKKKIRVFC